MRKAYAKYIFKYMVFIYILFDGQIINNGTTAKMYCRIIQRMKKYNIKATSDCEKFRFYKESVTS